MTEFGVGTYIRNVVRTLARLDCDSKYFLIGSLVKVAECGPLPPKFHAVELTGRDDTLKGNLAFRAIVRRLECDVVHIPHLFWIPRGLGCPYVLTVHDLLEHMYGSRHTSSLRRSLHFYLTRRVLRKAARVIAVSQFTKNEIEKLLAIPDERIEVVYNAIDERFLHGHATEADRELIAQRYLVNYPFRSEIEQLLAIPDERIEVVYNAIDERFLHGHATEADRELIAQRYLVNYPF